MLWCAKWRGPAGRPAGSRGSVSCVSRGLLSRHQVWVAFQLWQEEADLAVPCGVWVGRGVCGQFWTVPGSLCRCLCACLLSFTCETMCRGCGVITSHAYPRLIELITDKTVLSLSVGCIQLLVRVSSPRVTSRSVCWPSEPQSVGRRRPSGQLGDSASLFCSFFKGLTSAE